MTLSHARAFRQRLVEGDGSGSGPPQLGPLILRAVARRRPSSYRHVTFTRSHEQKFLPLTAGPTSMRSASSANCFFTPSNRASSPIALVTAGHGPLLLAVAPAAN